MTTIEQVIINSANPFDETYFKAGNFWLERPQEAQTLNSIHQEEINKIEFHLDKVIENQHSRTLFLLGDSGSGKTHLLGRLKQQFNSKAFFVYIEPWADSKYIWRHILRRTVDSLLEKPEGQEYSQLILWLKGLSAFKITDFRKWILGKRKSFINHLQSNYSSGIYNAREFFGVLYDLTNPELYPIASDYLRGDNLPEDDLNLIQVREPINNEYAAKNILENLGRIATETYPIILCFDQLDNIPLAPNGFIDLQSLFNVNTNIHTQYFKNFLILITLPTSTWKDNEQHIQPADLALGRIHDKIRLKPINKEQIKALLALRLSHLHSLATPRPSSPIHPFNDEQLKIRFFGGKSLPRTVLVVARELFQQYKRGLGNGVEISEEYLLIAFKLRWQEEFEKIKNKINHHNLVTSPKFIEMLQEGLDALGIKNIQTKVLKGGQESYCINYVHKTKKIGIVYTETQNMNSFFFIMNSCAKAVYDASFDHLFLMRNTPVGNPNLKGHQIYKQVFHTPNHHHLNYTLSSIHYLATYYYLVTQAKSKRLLLAGQDITLEKLKELIAQSEILNQCRLFQDLAEKIG